MKRNVLLGIILSGSSFTAFAQSSDIQKPITVTPSISIQNFDWLERSTVGKVGVQIQFKPINYNTLDTFKPLIYRNLLIPHRRGDLVQTQVKGLTLQ